MQVESIQYSITLVQGDDFCNRHQERNDLIKYSKGGNNVVLFSPRRYGKSSLVTNVLDELKKEGFLTVYIDLFPISSEQEVVTKLAQGFLKGIDAGADPRTFWDKAKDLFSRVIPTIDMGPDKVSVTIKFDWNSKVELLIEDVMEGMYRYIKENNLRACVVLDEFQEITELKEAKKIEGTLRSKMQFHKEISYFFVGSRRRVLKDMFTNKNRPFYKSAFLYEISEISHDHFVPYITSKFSKSGKTCSKDAAEQIYGMARGYPYYIQKLASIAWEMTEKECTPEIVRDAYSRLVKMEASDFEGIWSGLTLVQREVLKALSKEPTSTPYAREYLERYHLSIGGMQRTVRLLLEKDLIEEHNGIYRLTDPIMAAWLLDTATL